ncbi:cupin domain-containing protein [bacterium]|nr:cupin domain-containing protein [bacterium]
MKPLINLDELTLTHEAPVGDKFQSSWADISGKIGAKNLGYNLSVIPPGKRICPYHNHHVQEEMFFILEGEGTLRFGDQEYAIRKFDVISCPPGKRDVAHQIINTGQAEMRLLALSTKERAEICEYPDSDKVGVYVGEYGNQDIRKLFKLGHAVDYNEGE